MRGSTYHFYNNISWDGCQGLAALNKQENLACVLQCVVRERVRLRTLPDMVCYRDFVSPF
jgi:hypothetical protein